MIKARITLQDLRRRIYYKAKADKQHRFWGMYVHVCKPETLAQAYSDAKANNGEPGIDGVTFASIEASGRADFLQTIELELKADTYRPNRCREVQIEKENGKLRTLKIPTIKDRVVQTALKLILEAIFEADFQPNSFGYRPKKQAHQAIAVVRTAIARGKTKVIDVDLKSYLDHPS